MSDLSHPHPHPHLQPSQSYTPRSKSESEYTTVKFVLGSGAIIFLLATIFWAGATYNRIGSIETHLAAIEGKMLAPNDLVPLREQSSDNHERIQKLENQFIRMQLDPKYK